MSACLCMNEQHKTKWSLRSTIIIGKWLRDRNRFGLMDGVTSVKPVNHINNRFGVMIGSCSTLCK